MAKATVDLVRPTTLIETPALTAALGVPTILASEVFQYTGSFKFRAAYHLASNVPNDVILTASSGNFGQAIAYACKLLGKQAIVVMPETSAKVKLDAVRSHGATVVLVDTQETTRAAKVAEMSALHPDAYLASAYDDAWVIAGNATLGKELAHLDFATLVVPVGGGGLSAGIISGLRGAGHRAKIVGAEPLLANDAARSLREGRIVAQEREAQTIADGARTLSLGKRNWEILRDGLDGIVEVSEDTIRQGVRLLFSAANMKAEPTGALALGAMLTAPKRFREGPIVCVVSGGNVDPAVYASIIAS